MLEVIKLNNSNLSPASCIVIMPLYNRRHFLKQAFRSLSEQTYTDWELLIVDDGSTDNPFGEIDKHASQLSQSVTYVKQPNGGPGKARATGQSYIENHDYVAFFDSDDYWLADYLENAICQLEFNPDLDWFFCPCRRVDYHSGHTLSESTFKDSVTGKPLQFLALRTADTGGASVFCNNIALAITQLRQPINAGFQNSVMRSRLLKEILIPSYRIGEDRYFLMSAILKGYKIGFTDKVGVIYNVHDNNLSDTNPKTSNIEKAVKVHRELCNSFLALKKITNNELILEEIEKQVSDINFWVIGYHYYWKSGHIKDALYYMLSALSKNPKNIKYMKTFFICLLKAPGVFFDQLKT